MPMTTRRRLADTPIVPKIFFCLHCLRTSIKNFDVTNAENFAPGCVFDAVASVACKQYSSRNQICHQTSVGMLGNALEFSQILNWSQEFFVDHTAPDQNLDWDLTLRVQVGHLTLALATGFEAAELAHRREHGLTGTSKSKVTPNLVPYRSFVAGRRSIADDPTMLRLMPGDDGFLL
ncbi:uncharacterized protein BO95DRAFT_437881 [Aspergillus brunneoviolaceus CBS 621.78]|uniref:Uncharacterized protein n=1 Tax=Aspergillus brunneoviolaceus CBS 621.78 TaxID=1450534 RepID=A0ACD1GPT4_9EURO|nr:hypothetical protein BO95DRAFT_437881 [Aspergillus brunneoviolaceus CBS 621.78]RAH51076.1 hypothetical protein BO95DRAFT_437881 [Aspergillus brunneoviolaceus CBS 621.78]